MGGYVDAALRRVATLSDGWITDFYLPKSFRSAWERIEQHTEASGRDSRQLQRVSQLPICVANSYEEADKRVRDFVSRYFDVAPWSESTVESAIRGTPEQCAEQLTAQVAAGTRHIVLVPQDYAIEQIQAIARDVIPQVAQQRKVG